MKADLEVKNITVFTPENSAWDNLPVLDYFTSPEVILWVRVMMFNATFNNISVILGWSVLLVEETGVIGENHESAASH